MKATKRSEATRFRFRSTLPAILLGAYFLYFAAGAVHARFAMDDPMNLYVYWRRGLLLSIGDAIAFWTNSSRPMAATFYLPIYYWFGMNPLPYRIAILAIIAANVALSFGIALRLTASTAGALLVAVLVCAHGNMTQIYYNTSVIYDVLAFLFTALTLAAYMRARSRGGPSPASSAIIFALFWAAITSKEIATIGAVWLLAYEIFVAPRPRKFGLPLTLIALATGFAITRVAGPGSLAAKPGYQLHLAAAQFLLNARACANDLFYTNWFSSGSKLAAFCLAGFILCAIFRRREFWWAWSAVLISVFPLAFTSRPRIGPNLYLPWLAVALWIATLIITALGRWPIREWSACALIALLLATRTLPYWKSGVEGDLNMQMLTWNALTRIRELPRRPSPHSRVLFLNTPFADWDALFITSLVWNDHTLDVELASKLPAPPDPSRFDWVLTFEGARLRIVRSR